MLQVSEFGNLRIENPKILLKNIGLQKSFFSYFNVSVDSDIGNSAQLLGGHLLFKKNKHTENFLNEFFKLVDFDQNLITDFTKKNQIINFKENRHDQSIFSLLTKIFGGVILENETFFESNSLEQKDYPFLSVKLWPRKKKII